MTDEQDPFGLVQSHDHDGLRLLAARRPGLASRRNEEGVSLLLFCRYRGAHDCADVLLKTKPEMDVFEAAAFDKKRTLAKHLKRDPALVSARTADGWIPLHLACFFGGLDAVKVLVKAGADVDAVSENDMSGRPLHSAAARRELKMMRLLLDQGADVDARQAGGWTALHSAAHHGVTEIAEELLARGADRGVASDDGRTAADLAKAAGHDALAARLAP